MTLRYSSIEERFLIISKVLNSIELHQKHLYETRLNFVLLVAVH